MPQQRHDAAFGAWVPEGSAGHGSPGPGPQILEWDGGTGGDHGERRRRTAAAWLTGLTDPAQRRIVAVLIGAAAAALFASLLLPWQVTMLDYPGMSGTPQRIEAGAAALPGWGTSYLVGITAAVALTALTLFGTRPVRANARVAGLAVTAATVAIMVATAVELNRASVVFNLMRLPPSEGRFDAAYGAGLHLAFGGLAALAVGLYLSRTVQARDHDGPGPAGPGVRSADSVAPGPAPTGRDEPAWRRPDRSDQPDAPLDLRVGPAAPFVLPPDQHGTPR